MAVLIPIQVCELCSSVGVASTDRYSERLQSAEYYAIDGDHSEILELLLAQGEDSWLPWQQKRPLLHLACERGAWNCVRFLVAERSEELNQCYDEYFPIHQAALQVGRQSCRRVCACQLRFVWGMRKHRVPKNSCIHCR